MSNWPVHNNPRSENAAKAPYNFVPLPDQIVTVDPNSLPDQDRYDPGRYTGWLDCRLTTESPLYIRAALEQKEFERTLDEKAEAKRPWDEQVRNKPDFFYTTDRARPVIPGSSLRGMLRALVEIAGYGKMQWVTSRQLIYRAVGDTTSHGARYRDRLMHSDGEWAEDGKRCHHYTPLMQAGYMEELRNGDWQIRPATSIGGTTFARISERRIPSGLKPVRDCKNASEIWVQPGRYEYQKVRGGFLQTKYAKVIEASATEKEGLKKATLARSGWMPNKRSEAVIFAKNTTAAPISVGDELIRAYRDHLSDVYGQQSLRGTEKESILGPNGVLVDGHPVFYLVEDGKLVFFSHCMMFRLPYHRSPLHFVPPWLCQETDTDLAEALFGYTKKSGQGKERGYAGRVFLSDAHLAPDQPDDIWLAGDDVLIPRILGGPKPTTFQHYLVQKHPNPVPTGGQFADGRPRTQLHLSDYAADTPGDTVIRGHKLYWHKGPVGLEQLREPEKVGKNDRQHTQMRPVKAGVTFAFRIRFENLSKVELGSLQWVLDRAQDPALRLSLGMGKPYGMGAVRIESTLHVEDRRARYEQLFRGDEWAMGQTEAPNLQAEAVLAFERFVLDALGERSARCLTDLPRIQALLAMLAWPGPNSKETRYLEIERKDQQAKGGKVNEYKDRPVLPDPLVVTGSPVAATRPVRAQADALPAGYKRGTVKSFGLGPKQSYGYVTVESTGDDLFVHKSQLGPGVTTLQPGQKVTFRVGQGMKGREAQDVRLE